VSGVEIAPFLLCETESVKSILSILIDKLHSDDAKMLSLLCCAKIQLKSKNRCYKLKNHTSRVLAPGEKSKNPILTAKLYIGFASEVRKIDLICKTPH